MKKAVQFRPRRLKKQTMANTKNLQPVRTKAEARERGKAGGIKSGEARREKKLMSAIYADFLAEKFTVKIDGIDQSITGGKLVNRVVKQILATGGPGAVSMLKEIREATEGSKLDVNNTITPVQFELVDPPVFPDDDD